MPGELNAVTREILGAALAVHTALGAGFSESIYEEAMCLELDSMGLAFRRQVRLDVAYRGHRVGVHRLDLIVADVIVVELKAVDELAKVHIAQLLSYLRASNRPVGLLINFNVAHLRNGIRRLTAPSP